MQVDPLSHVASRFAHAVTMLAALIPFTADASLDRVVSIACLEDWFTNYRLLIEFLLGRPPGNCASAKTFVPTWVPDLAVKREMMPDFGWASEDVAHIGQPSSAERGDVDPPTLHRKAEALFHVVADFSDAMTAEDHPYAFMVQIALRQGRELLQRS